MQAFLDEFYALPEHLDGGVEGMFARLAERGISITSPAPGRFVAEEGKVGPGWLARVKAAYGC